MENKITGGEWNAKDGQICSLQTGKTLALIPYWDNEPEQEANAQLIAASPTMLNALLEIRRQGEYIFTEYATNKHLTEAEQLQMFKQYIGAAMDTATEAINQLK